MADFIALEDIEDEILVPLITQSDVTYANKRISAIAMTLGVAEDAIALPPADEVKELAIAVACEHRAKLSIGTGTRVDNAGRDVYAVKQSIYARDVMQLTSRLTPEILQGTADSAVAKSSTIELFRA